MYFFCTFSVYLFLSPPLILSLFSIYAFSCVFIHVLVDPKWSLTLSESVTFYLSLAASGGRWAAMYAWNSRHSRHSKSPHGNSFSHCFACWYLDGQLIWPQRCSSLRFLSCNWLVLNCLVSKNGSYSLIRSDIFNSTKSLTFLLLSETAWQSSTV